MFQSKSDEQASADATLKKLLILSRRASPALRVAIEMQTTDACDTLAELVDRASKVADDRALPRLRQLERVTGCGVDKSQDCYPCLRDSDAMAMAIARAQNHPGPKLESGYR